MEQVKCHHMRRVLEAAGGNKSAAARRLGISRKTLERKLGVSEFSD
ncbi:MAG: helix-turn-helix domain-containing protein [Chromatiales bacterium]|nr:helix-turn-helix domain-containing protein [Chromatiales bacterium]